MQTTTRNASLGELAALLTEQQARKLDIVLPATAIRSRDAQIVVESDEAVIDNDGVWPVRGTYTPTALVDEHVAEKLSIPLPYLRRLRESRPDIYDANVNGWLHGSTMSDYRGPHDVAADPRSFMLRLFRGGFGSDEPGVARALLSERYRIVDNFDVLTAALEGVKSADADVTFAGCDLTDRRMYVRVRSNSVAVLAPELLRGYRSPFTGASADDNPTVFAGFVISNSETGGGAFTLTPRIEVEVCTNGMTITRDALRNVHLGSKVDAGVIQWSDDTQRKNLELVTAQTRDAVATFLDVEYVRGAISRMTEQASKPLDKPADAVKIVGKQLAFSAERTEAVLDHFIRGGQMTAGGIMQAVTSVAQTIADADDAAEFEAAGVRALEVAATL